MKMDSTEIEQALKAIEAAHCYTELNDAESLCKVALQMIDQKHVCSTFSNLVIQLARLRSRISDDRCLDDALQHFQSHLNCNRSCVLLHQLHDCTSSFQGTARSFECLVPVDLATEVADHVASCPAVTPLVLESLCRVCLDSGLSSSALNLALQLHLIAQYQEQETTNPSKPYVLLDSSEFTLISDHVKSDPSPVGLPPDLWSGLCSLCSSTATQQDTRPCEPLEPITNGPSSRDDRNLISLNLTNGETHVSFEGDNSNHNDVRIESDRSSESPTSHNDYLTGVYEMLNHRTTIGWPDSQSLSPDSDTVAYPASAASDQSLDETSSSEENDDELTELSSTQENWSADAHETPPCVVRRCSILKCSEKSDGELSRSGCKRVRFSLGSSHPSPALEDEYGGRSNRRRLLDFARRRQLLVPGSGDVQTFNLRNNLPMVGMVVALFQFICSPFTLLFRLVKQAIPLLRSPVRILLSVLFFSLFVLLSMVLFATIACGCILHRSSWFDSWDFPTISWSTSHYSHVSTLREICEQSASWITRVLGQTPKSD